MVLELLEGRPLHEAVTHPEALLGGLLELGQRRARLAVLGQRAREEEPRARGERLERERVPECLDGLVELRVDGVGVAHRVEHRRPTAPVPTVLLVRQLERAVELDELGGVGG